MITIHRKFFIDSKNFINNKFSINRKFFYQWRFPLLLLAFTALVATGSWIFNSLHKTVEAGTANTSFAESLFPGNFVRMGATTDQTIEDLQAHLKQMPKDWDVYSQLGLAYLQKVRETGDPSYYPKVEQAFQKTLANIPGDYTAVGGMGTLALARHQFQSALDIGQRARDLDPNNPYSYGIIADAEIELGKYPDAVQTLQEMVNLRPDLNSFSRVSYIRELYGQTDQAIQAMQMAADSGEPQLENTAWTRTQLGNLYFNTGNLQQAEAEYQTTLQGYPNYIYALAGLGHVRAAQGKFDEAITYLSQASQRIPIPDFIIALGDAYQMSGQTAAAQREYSLVHAIQKLYQANGVDLDLEISMFNADHQYDPQGTLAQARQAYTKRPSIFGADVLAWSLYQAGQYPEAQKYSQLALRLGTKDTLKLYHAGMISLKLGQNDQARQYLGQALAINPNFSILFSGQAQKTLTALNSAANH